MHIVIGGLLALAGLIWAILKVMDALGDAKGAARKFSWSRKYHKSIFDTLSDPQESVAILMLQIASYTGEITAGQKAAIISQMRKNFQSSASEAEDLYGFARHAIAQTADAANILSKILAPVKNTCTESQKRELIDILKSISVSEGEPDSAQLALIDRVQYTLDIKA